MLFSNDLLWIISLLLILTGLWTASRCLHCIRKRKVFAATRQALFSFILLLSGTSVIGIQTGMAGYRELSKEQAVLQIETFPLSDHRFSALVTWPDGQQKAFYLYGDQLYIDAQILKWQPAATVLGLETYYELDRIGGRYNLISDEQEKRRSLFSLKSEKSVDIYALAKSQQWLTPFIDTAYGSATFIDVNQPAVWELNVSTTGLLIRKLK